jgi:hypothetical protein
MLALAGHPHAVNPDRNLRKLAAARGWPILDFSKPVALTEHSRFGEAWLPAVVVTALTAAGVALYAARRRARTVGAS